MPILDILIASTRPGRVGATVADWVQATTEETSTFAVRRTDLKTLDLPLMNEPNHPRLRAYEHQHTKDWSERVDQADAFLFVMPEYNYGFNAPLKNAIDYLYAEWRYKPVGFVSYGGVSGGLRAVQMIKQVVTTLNMMPINESVSIPHVKNLIQDGQLQPTDPMEHALRTTLDELARWEEALRPMRTEVRTGR